MEKGEVLNPLCYKRHAEIEGHIMEGKFWRGVVVAMLLLIPGILIAQYNLSIENNGKLVAITTKLTTMVEINTSRLNRIEELLFITHNKGELK